jgi:hypothetical protein
MGWRERTDDLRERGLVEMGTTLYVRDRDAFASVLGSAIALRLFLFVIPANIALVALVHLLHLTSVFNSTLESSVTTGELAANFDQVTFWSQLWTFVSSLALTVWAGRSLARVLATGSTSAWQMPPATAKLGTRAVLALSALLFAIIAMSAILEKVRDIGGVAISFLGWVGVFAIVTLGWFMLTLTLPRPTSDPGAVLPGVLVVALGFTVLQWFMQFYLPRKIEESSDTLGDLSATVAALGYFFFIGRLVAGAMVVSAVSYERWGSISSQVFDLPGVRQLSARFPRLRAYFDQPSIPVDPSA